MGIRLTRWPNDAIRNHHTYAFMGDPQSEEFALPETDTPLTAAEWFASTQVERGQEEDDLSPDIFKYNKQTLCRPAVALIKLKMTPKLWRSRSCQIHFRACGPPRYIPCGGI